MNISNGVIDLTQSFSVAKKNSATMPTIAVIDLLDSDESFNSSFATLVIEDNDSVQEIVSCKKKNHHERDLKLDGKFGKRSSSQKSSGGKKRKFNGWGDCPICWDELGRNPLVSTKCGHVYCSKCLEKSLKIEKRCPTCRRVLKGSSAYHPLYINM